MPANISSLGDLVRLRSCKSRRISSYDKTGGNADYWRFEAGEKKVIAEIKGAGIIRHIWMTIGCKAEHYPRKILLRMFWDGEKNPSVEAPIGDFFGMGHGILRNFVSAPLMMSPQDGKGMNCYFPMPFERRSRIEIENECETEMVLYFYVDYEQYQTMEKGIARLHAQWRRENPTKGIVPRGVEHEKELWAEPNLDGKENYVILEAKGRGHYVGCHLDIDCFERGLNDWYGEGDDMIFIDGEGWPPSLHGTGTEDYVSMAYGPSQEYNSPYHGLTLYSGTDDWKWKGKNSVYRYHIQDPVHFKKSIKVTIEHGHANALTNDYSSTAYWYQREPHLPFPRMLPVKQRLPRH